MKIQRLKILPAALLSLGFIASVPTFAENSALPTEPQTQSAATESVQPSVNAKATEQVAEKRRKIAADAVTAVNETKKALKLLDEKKKEEALDALKATLEEQEKSLLEAKTALKEREEFLEASENKLFEKLQAQQERQIELEQWAEELGAKEASLKSDGD